MVHGITDGPEGLFYGNPAFFFTQLKAMAIVVAYSFAVSYGYFQIHQLHISDACYLKEEELGLDAITAQ